MAAPGRLLNMFVSGGAVPPLFQVLMTFKDLYHAMFMCINIWDHEHEIILEADCTVDHIII